MILETRKASPWYKSVIEADIPQQSVCSSQIFFDRPVVAKFDQRQGSSDGGAVLLKAANQRLGLTSALAACLKEERQPGKILHEIEELLTQRVIQGGKSTKGGLR